MNFWWKGCNQVISVKLIFSKRSLKIWLLFRYSYLAILFKFCFASVVMTPIKAGLTTEVRVGSPRSCEMTMSFDSKSTNKNNPRARKAEQLAVSIRTPTKTPLVELTRGTLMSTVTFTSDLWKHNKISSGSSIILDLEQPCLLTVLHHGSCLNTTDLKLLISSSDNCLISAFQITTKIFRCKTF